MKNIIKSSLFLAFGAILSMTAAAQNNDVSLKIGGSYFINCKRAIAFGEQSVMSVSGDDKTGRKVDFDIFSPSGTLDASLKDGNFSGAKAKFYAVNRFNDGFTARWLTRGTTALC